MLYKQWTGFKYIELTDKFRSDQEETYPYFYTFDIFEQRIEYGFYHSLFHLEHLNGKEIILKSKEIVNLFNKYINKYIQENEIGNICLQTHLEILIGIVEANNLDNKIDSEKCFLLSIMLFEITLESYNQYLWYIENKISKSLVDPRSNNVWLLSAIDAFEAQDYAVHLLGIHHEKSHAALKRHEKNRKLRHIAIDKYKDIRKSNTKITLRAISRKIAPEIIKKADEIGFRYSEDRFVDTIYDWIRKENKDK